MRRADLEELQVLKTERLVLRKLTLNDASFILELLNEPAFVRFIGDRGVRTLEQATNYLVSGPIDSYKRHGFGLWLVQLKNTQEPIGICGLVKRNTLPNIDIGYAFLERFWSKGFASESALAVKDYAMQVLGLTRLLAITDQDNTASIKLLEKIGLRYEQLIKLADGGPELKLFSVGE